MYASMLWQPLCGPSVAAWGPVAAAAVWLRGVAGAEAVWLARVARSEPEEFAALGAVAAEVTLEGVEGGVRVGPVAVEVAREVMGEVPAEVLTGVERSGAGGRLARVRGAEGATPQKTTSSSSSSLCWVMWSSLLRWASLLPPPLRHRLVA